MRPLVISLLPRPPHPTREGGAIRNYQLLEALSSEFRVRALSLMPPGADRLPWSFPPGVESTLVPLASGIGRAVGSVGRSVLGEPYTVAKYRSQALDAAIADHTGRESPAWVISHGYHLGQAAIRSGLPVWIDLHNIESTIWLRMSRTAQSPLVRLATAWQTPLVRRLERALFTKADGLSVVSFADAETARVGVPTVMPLVVPNGVDLERYTFRERPADHVLAFVGDLRWRPNAEGIAWFHRAVWPLLRERVPAARVEILGRGAGPSIRRFEDDRFRFLGDEPDTRTLWSRAAVGLVPLLAGGGTRLKILEAAAMGVPVVSTSVGAEGLELDRAREIFVRDEPDDWVTVIATLLSDPALRQSMAARARSRVEHMYDWRRIGSTFASHIAELARRRGG